MRQVRGNHDGRARAGLEQENVTAAEQRPGESSKMRARKAQGRSKGARMQILSLLTVTAVSTAQGRSLSRIVMHSSLRSMILKVKLGIESAVRIRPLVVRSFDTFLG